MIAFRVFSSAYEKKFLLFTSFQYTLSSIQIRKIGPQLNKCPQNNLCSSPISFIPKYVCHSQPLSSFGRMTWICSCMRKSGTSFVFELAELPHWHWKLQLLLSRQLVALCHFHCRVLLSIQGEVNSLTTSV